MDLEELQRNWDALAQTEPWESALCPPGYEQGERWKIEDFFATGDQEVAALVQYITSLGLEIPIGEALDFGCGMGRVTLPLSQNFELCYGIDIAPTMIELAKQYRAGEHCRYILSESEDLSMFADNSLVFIYSMITFQNMLPQYTKKYLREFMRTLKPGGLTVFQAPSTGKTFRLRLRNKIPRFLLDWFFWIKYRGHPRLEMHGVPKQEVIALLEANGGRVIDIVADQRAFHDWYSFRYCVRKEAT